MMSYHVECHQNTRKSVAFELDQGTRIIYIDPSVRQEQSLIGLSATRYGFVSN